MYERVLVPMDRSDHAMAAARHAFGLAETYGATVHALYVIDTGTGWFTVSKADVRGALREVGEDAGESALAAIEKLAESYDVELVTELREGTPENEILAYAESEGIDLVVMGTHGREGVRRSLVGSVTEHVVRESPVPVLTVRADPDA
jgi:nucleotide-binding universal stress UspA family protein